VVKIKSLWLIKHNAMQSVWGSGEVAPHILGEHESAALPWPLHKKAGLSKEESLITTDDETSLCSLYHSHYTYRYLGTDKFCVGH
jgi:hypothetical protein